MGGNLAEFTDTNFRSEVLGSDVPVLVDFWAEWCAPCRLIEPYVQEIAGEYAGKIRVGRLNVDHNPETATQYGIRSIPNLLVFKNGAISDQMVGAVPKQSITRMLDRVLDN
ncbi:MAG: thioredoxin [Fidelibacterota bacterium]